MTRCLTPGGYGGAACSTRDGDSCRRLLRGASHRTCGLLRGVELDGLQERVERGPLVLDEVGGAVEAEEPGVAAGGLDHDNPVALRGIPVGAGAGDRRAGGGARGGGS